MRVQRKEELNKNNEMLKHCNNCPNLGQKKYPSMYITIIPFCNKYNKQLYYYGDENETPIVCKECKKRFSYVPYIEY